MDVNKRTLRHHRKVDRHDRWTSTCTIAVPGGDSYDYCSALGHAETGNILVTDGLSAKTRPQIGHGRPPADAGFSRSRERPRTMKIESLPLGRSGETELRPVGFPAAEQRHEVGIPLCPPEEGNGKDGKWGESGGRTLPNANTADTSQIASDGDGSDSNLQRAGPVQNDRVEGAYIVTI